MVENHEEPFQHALLELQRRNLELLKQNGTLWYPHLERLGDVLIYHGIHWQVAKLLNNSYVAKMTSKKESSQTPLEMLHTLNKPTDAPVPIQQQILHDLGNALGVDVSRINVDRPPLLVPLVVQEDDQQIIIDANKIRKEGEQIRETFNNRNIVILYQAGSIATKRFSKQTIQELCRVVRNKDPHAYIVVFGDGRDFDHVPRIHEGDTVDGADEVFVNPSLHDLGKWGYAADSIIGTDTGYSWFLTSCMADRLGGGIPDDKVFFLYTVADPRVWGIPGATNVSSHFIDYMQNSTPDDLALIGSPRFVNGVIDAWSTVLPSAYTRFNSQGDISAVKTPIHEEDIKNFMSYVSGLLKLQVVSKP